MGKNRGKGSESDAKLRAYYDRTSRLAEGGRLESVTMSFPKPRRLIGLRLDEETLLRVKRLAAEKGLNFSTLMRMWITERLRAET